MAPPKGEELRPAPPPGPPLEKAHDISFDKEKTLIRTLSNLGEGAEEAREASYVIVHYEVLQPSDDGGLERVYNSRDDEPTGVRFEVGRCWLSEGVERSIINCKPGAVIDSLCTDPDMAYDITIGFTARKIPDAGEEFWNSPQGPIGCAQGANDPPPFMNFREDEIKPPWKPSPYATLFHIELVATSPGAVPMFMEPEERLRWVEERKAWGLELYRRGLHARAMRTFRKAMLDLEVPCDWEGHERLNVRRNNLRMSLHLNVAACELHMPAAKPYANLQQPRYHYDPHKDAIFHCTKVLNVDVRNVKALYRRATAHLTLPAERHVNGVDLALADLELALELDPENPDVQRQMKRAKQIKKEEDRKAAGTFAKMINTSGDVV